jgi:hypothetical protein
MGSEDKFFSISWRTHSHLNQAFWGRNDTNIPPQREMGPLAAPQKTKVKQTHAILTKWCSPYERILNNI